MPTTMNHNHADYEKRLKFIGDLLKDKFGLEGALIEPIAYEADCPFSYNNFVYKVTAPEAHHFDDHSKNLTKQPGCSPIPEGTDRLILRLSNVAASGMAKLNRIENEVAMINLFARALTRVDPKIVPSVYGWGSAVDADSSQGYILQELMPGSPVDDDLERLTIAQKRLIFSQMAEILKAIQQFQLPPSIRSLGGLTYDAKDNMVSAPMTTESAGPWPSYEAFFRDRLQMALDVADQNPHIKGWRQNGVRERLVTFIEKGLTAQFEHLAFVDEKCIVHADFTGNNLLYDPKSLRISALLDYDFGCISHTSYEFLRSFNGNGGPLAGYSGDDDTAPEWLLTTAKLHGFPEPLPASKPDDDVDWEVSKVWEEELSRAAVKRPSTIAGIGKVADMNALLTAIAPWRLTNEEIQQSEEVMLAYRAQTEERLIQMLSRLGF